MDAHHHRHAIGLHGLLVALAGAAFALTGVASFQAVWAQAPAQQPAAATIPPDQLDSLVAPIALYPDPLLAQVLAASTYPVEIIQLQQWLAKNPGLKDQALEDAVSKQPWDPSVKGLAGLPDVIKRLADDRFGNFSRLLQFCVVGASGMVIDLSGPPARQSKQRRPYSS